MMMHCKFHIAFSFALIFFLFIASWRTYGYAEIHYTFFGYSLISRKHPEIIIDAPWRTEPGKPIPIVCIIKDSDRYPIKIERITARYKMENEEIQSLDLLSAHQSLSISDHYWYMMNYLELPSDQTGDVEISVEVEYIRKGKKQLIVTDNLPGLSHAPLKVFVSPQKLPALDGWYYGDAHYHSDMTQDQVEFGAPAEVAVEMGKAMGLSWLAITDHSYDLDIAIGEFFKRDHKLTRWQKMREDAERINSENDRFVVIPAEEVSCGNCRDHNVHLLAFGISEFIPGRGDGVKRGINKEPDLTLRQSLQLTKEMNGFAYAAHPEVGNGFMGTLLLNRGHWKDGDYIADDYSGLQFWNGKKDDKFQQSYEKWVQLLLDGRRLYILGGNDAHGDFNRCRKIKYPNTKLTESFDHVFGKTRTYAYCGKHVSLDGILDAMRNGRTIVTNGPVAILRVQNDNGRTAIIGEEISGREYVLQINAKSSKEFGKINRIDLYRGTLISKNERLEETFVPDGNVDSHVFNHKIEHNGECYIRVEARSSAMGEEYTCYTNPIWLRST